MINGLADLLLFTAEGCLLVIAFDMGIGYIFDKVERLKLLRSNI